MSHAVLPHKWYPEPLLKVVDDYANSLGDDLVRGVPAWFAGMVWMEVLVQIPASCFLLWVYHAKAKILKPAVLVYSAQVLTTMIPIFFHFQESLQPPHRWCVMSIYSPWAIMPIVMALRVLLVSGPRKKVGNIKMS